jgi:hypothetical protein
MFRRSLATSLAAAAALTSADARALDPEITSDTSAQFYDVRSPTGETILPRRRLTSTLGVATYDLMPAPPAVIPDASSHRSPAGEISFRARVRYDADYGANGGETSPTDYEHFVPGFARMPIDLMYGYVEGRRLFGGWFGFKLGRQYVTDALGFWSFDGGLVRLTTPYYFAVEALGGLEVRSGMPLATARYERDGIWRGDRGGFDETLYPSYQPSEVAPALGVAVESTGVTWIHGRLSYRRVTNTGKSNVSSFANGIAQPVTYDGTRISQERIGYAVDAVASDLGGAKAGLVYDLYAARFTNLYASVDGYLTSRLTLSADYDFYAPSYDGDSIWNFFLGNPMNDVALRTTWEVTDTIALSGGTNARVFATETAPSNPIPSPNVTPATNGSYFPSSGATFDGGGFVAARRRTSRDLLGVRANALFGHEGHRTGLELQTERNVFSRTVLVGRASYFEWEDRLRPDRSANSFGFVAGIGYRVAPRARAQIEYELDTNRLVGLRNRIVLWLTVAAR